MMAAGDPVRMRRLRDELVGKDYFQTFPDFNAYLVRKEETVRDCAAAPPRGRSRKALLNIAGAGFFSAGRTVAEYNRDIWHLD